eukprot:2396096-Pleurochrysis_carterae.AAC.1
MAHANHARSVPRHASILTKGECIASDLCEMPTSSPFGFRYMLCFYDLATKYLEVYYLRNASSAEVKSSFQTFLADNQCYLSESAVTWLIDSGSEFFEKNLDAFLCEFLIRHKCTVPYNPQTSPVERQPTSANGFSAGQSIRSWPFITTRWLRAEALLQLRARHPPR